MGEDNVRFERRGSWSTGSEGAVSLGSREPALWTHGDLNGRKHTTPARVTVLPAFIRVLQHISQPIISPVASPARGPLRWETFDQTPLFDTLAPAREPALGVDQTVTS